VDIFALAVAPSAVYAGGDGGALAFDPKTGTTLDWHPALSGGGLFSEPYVHALAVAGSTVYVGDEAGLEAFSR
jgi:outer membrane protein assembly factor BamB